MSPILDEAFRRVREKCEAEFAQSRFDPAQHCVHPVGFSGHQTSGFVEMVRVGCGEELKKRARYAWECLRDTLSRLRFPMDGMLVPRIQYELLQVVEGQRVLLERQFSDFLRKLAVTEMSDVGRNTLGGPQNSILHTLQFDINHFAYLKENEPPVRDTTTIINSQGVVVGSHNTAITQTFQLDGGVGAKIIGALDDISAKISDVAQHSDLNEGEVSKIIQEARTEVSSPAHDRARLGRALLAVGALIQTLGSVKPACDIITQALMGLF